MSNGFIADCQKWQHDAVFILGGGYSLHGFDFQRLQDRTVLAINDGGIHVPWADTWFSVDTTWITRRHSTLEGYGGDIVLAVPSTFDRAKGPSNARYIERICQQYLSDRPNAISMGGGHSGFGALNLAVLQGAREIYLLGFDFCVGPKNRIHWHEGYRWQGGFNSRMYMKWAATLDRQAHVLNKRGIKVVNVVNRSHMSRLTRFPIAHLEEL